MDNAHLQHLHEVYIAIQFEKAVAREGLDALRKQLAQKEQAIERLDKMAQSILCWINEIDGIG